MWLKISSKILLDHPRLLVEEDQVKLPSGQQISYLKYGYNGNGVIVCATDSNGRMLFVREYSYVLDKVILSLPMGKINAGESAIFAANRELSEETGFISNSLDEIGRFNQNHRRSNNTAHLFSAKDLVKHSSPKDLEESDIEIIWLSTNDIHDQILSGNIVDSDTLSSLYLFTSYNSQSNYK